MKMPYKQDFIAALMAAKEQGIGAMLAFGMAYLRGATTAIPVKDALIDGLMCAMIAWFVRDILNFIGLSTNLAYIGSVFIGYLVDRFYRFPDWRNSHRRKSGWKMQTSDKGIALIKSSKAAAADCLSGQCGVWTIGYGWTQPVDGKTIRAGMTIKQETAERLLKTGLVSYENDVMKLVCVKLTQGQFDALVSFTYNLGARSLSTSTLLKKLNSGDYAGAADEFRNGIKLVARYLMGLRRRRQSVLCFCRDYPD
jgi:lambda family phage holin